MLAVAVAVWTFVEIARIFEDVVVLVPTETVVVLVIVFDKVIVFISIVGMQVVGKSIVFNVANFVVLRLLVVAVVGVISVVERFLIIRVLYIVVVIIVFISSAVTEVVGEVILADAANLVALGWMFAVCEEGVIAVATSVGFFRLVFIEYLEVLRKWWEWLRILHELWYFLRKLLKLVEHLGLSLRHL